MLYGWLLWQLAEVGGVVARSGLHPHSTVYQETTEPQLFSFNTNDNAYLSEL